jgi:Ca-activated chloride channel family protein
MKPIHYLFTLSFTVFFGTVNLHAGEIFGTVTDTSGRAAGSVKVTISSTKDPRQRETTTNTIGSYTFPRLDTGEYIVGVKHPGFAMQQKKGIVVRDQERAHVDFTLGVAELTETIDVSDKITVLCTVTDKNGLYITHLSKEDFLLKEDGRSQRIAQVSQETSLPLTLAILIDTSMSVEPILSLEKQTAKQFLKSVLREQDLAMVMSFDRNPSIATELTADMKQLEKAIDSISIGQGTSLHDAVFRVCTEKLVAQGGRKAIILISDGDDTTSQIKFANAIDSVHRADAIVYAVSNRIAAEGSFGNGRVLKQYAEETGGRAFFSGNLQDIKRGFDAIQEELRGQYILSYDSSNTAQDGRYRKLRVLLTKHPELKVRTKKGYFAPRSPTPSTVSKNG